MRQKRLKSAYSNDCVPVITVNMQVHMSSSHCACEGYSQVTLHFSQWKQEHYVCMMLYFSVNVHVSRSYCSRRGKGYVSNRGLQLINTGFLLLWATAGLHWFDFHMKFSALVFFIWITGWRIVVFGMWTYH